MIKHTDIEAAELRAMIKQNLVRFGGNRSLKIYGGLSCTSGKKIKRGNRVFFNSEQDALQNGYRPCGHCMKAAYKKWKHGII